MLSLGKLGSTDTFCYEIFFDTNNITIEAWQNFLKQIASYLGRTSQWQIITKLEYNVFHYYLNAPRAVPINLANGGFLLKPTKITAAPTRKNEKIFWNTAKHHLIPLTHSLNRKGFSFTELQLNFRFSKQSLHGIARALATGADKEPVTIRLALFAPSVLLSADFSKNKSFSYKKFPKYLQLDKLLSSINQESENSLLKVDTFPYADGDFFLHLHDYDFAKHSLILGSSGAGKSKLISLLIHDIARESNTDYKVVVIDPHDNLKNDLADIEQQNVIDFQTLENSIDLFKSISGDLNASVELALNLFQNLLGQSYNGQIGRVLRFSIYLLLAQDRLSFLNLRMLLTDLDYRMRTVREMDGKVPTSVTRFFLTDYNEIKNQFYKDAIAPIITFIDEMQMVPVFNEDVKVKTLSDILTQNFLTIFSLNRLSLGDKVTQTIAGLLMQQLFLLVQAQKFDQHLIIVIDEVAAIENPILTKFLAELRKYHASVILAGQYFTQVSEGLRASILANMANFYIFRVSKNDANLIVQNLEMKLVGEKSRDDQIDLLTHLENRECIARISRSGKLLPAFRTKTVDCSDLEYQPSAQNTHNNSTAISGESKQFNFTTNSEIKVGDIMKVNSTSRKKLP